MMGIFYEALQRWVGDATRVVALAKVVTQTRLDAEAAALTGVRVPDHVDVLADMASVGLAIQLHCRSRAAEAKAAGALFVAKLT
jgi:hypothetical protein